VKFPICKKKAYTKNDFFCLNNSYFIKRQPRSQDFLQKAVGTRLIKRVLTLMETSIRLRVRVCLYLL